jgi:hypothetical protein
MSLWRKNPKVHCFTWKAVLKRIYEYSPYQYYLYCDFDQPQKSEGIPKNPRLVSNNGQIEELSIYKELKNGKINLHDTRLVSDLKITDLVLEQNLLFLFSNKLIQPGDIHYCKDREHADSDCFTGYSQYLELTEKGFNVALENQKQEKEEYFSTTNLFLTFTLVITTMYTFLNELHLIDSNALLLTYIFGILIYAISSKLNKRDR